MQTRTGRRSPDIYLRGYFHASLKAVNSIDISQSVLEAFPPRSFSLSGVLSVIYFSVL